MDVWLHGTPSMSNHCVGSQDSGMRLPSRPIAVAMMSGRYIHSPARRYVSVVPNSSAQSLVTGTLPASAILPAMCTTCHLDVHMPLPRFSRNTICRYETALTSILTRQSLRSRSSPEAGTDFVSSPLLPNRRCQPISSGNSIGLECHADQVKLGSHHFL